VNKINVPRDTQELSRTSLTLKVTASWLPVQLLVQHPPQVASYPGPRGKRLGDTWRGFPCVKSVYFVNDCIPYQIHSNSCSRQLLVMAKWKDLDKQKPEVNLGRLEQQFYQAATFFHVLKNLMRFVHKTG